MTPRDRYYRAMINGGRFFESSWDDLVIRSVASEQESVDEFRVFSSNQEEALEAMRRCKRNVVMLEPGMVLARASDILGADAEIARAQMELDEVRELAEQDINDARRSRMLNLLDAVRRKIATRGEAS